MTQKIPSGIIAAFVTVVLTTALSITYTFAQTTESIVINEPNAADAKLDSSENTTDRSALVPVEPTKDPKVLGAVVAKLPSNENSTSVPVELSTDLTIPPAVGVYMQHRFNEMRSKLLDDRAAIIDYWLIAITIVLGVVAIVAVLGGYIGFQRFREIEKEAKGYAETAKGYSEATEHEFSKSKENRENQEKLNKMSAVTAENDPEEAQQVADNVKKDPDATLIEKAIGSAISLQQRDLINDAVDQWGAIARVVQESDNVLAAKAWMSIGYLRARDDTETAISAYDNAIKLHPNYHEAYFNRGVVKRTMRKFDEAIADYDMAIKIKPDFAMAYNNRALIWAAKNNFKVAKEDLDIAFQLMPHSAEILNNRGHSNAMLGKFVEASSDYDKAINLRPYFAPAYKNRGNLKMLMEKYEDALSDFTIAISLDPNFASAYYARGDANAKLGLIDNTRKDLETAIELAQTSNDSVLEQDATQALLDLDANKGDV